MKTTRFVGGAEAVPDDAHDDCGDQDTNDSEMLDDSDAAGKNTSEPAVSGAAKAEMVARNEDIADSLAACSLLASTRSV